MSNFTADIGCWDHGKNVDLPNAKNVAEAVSEAEELIKTTTFKKPILDPYVVQIRDSGKLVWDYMNGSSAY